MRPNGDEKTLRTIGDEKTMKSNGGEKTVKSNGAEKTVRTNGSVAVTFYHGGIWRTQCFVLQVPPCFLSFFLLTMAYYLLPINVGLYLVSVH